MQGKGFHLRYVVLLMAVSTILCGCGGGKIESGSSANMGENISPETENLGSIATIDIAAIENMEWRDNSMDLYSATVNQTFRTEVESEDFRGEYYCLRAGSASCYIHHQFMDYEKNQSEMSVITVEGESEAFPFTFDGLDILFQMGSVAGSDHYILHIRNLEDDSLKLCFYETDEKFSEIAAFTLNTAFPGIDEWVQGVLKDVDGRFHVLSSYKKDNMTFWRYCVVSEDGQVLSEHCDKYQEASLALLYDGHVALQTLTGTKDLELYSLENGEIKRLTTAKKGNLPLIYATLMDEETILYVDSTGIYRQKTGQEEAEALYVFRNHGISVSDVGALEIGENQTIRMIYVDSEGPNYLCLEPTTEKIECQEITLAVNSVNEVYKVAAAEFNKKYPTYHINIKEDYDKTRLLSELIAGDGPVLIDTFGLDFYEHTDLWEPLEGVFEQLGLDGELQQKAMDIGRIDGTLYGVITDFYLETVLTADKDIKDWNYDTFLQCIEEHPGLERAINGQSDDDRWTFMVMFFINGLEDNYFLDAESATTIFGTDKFSRFLDLAERYCMGEQPAEGGKAVLEGRMLCNYHLIDCPNQVALIRKCYGDDINFIGFPSAKGSKTNICGKSPLAIRRTATKAEKEGALLFLKMLLSYECQSRASKKINFALSVRKDVLEEQIRNMSKNKGSFVVSGFPAMYLEKEDYAEVDRETLYALIEQSRPTVFFPRELTNILVEEMSAYMDGGITKEELMKHLDNRVTLYLAERK